MGPFCLSSLHGNVCRCSRDHACDAHWTAFVGFGDNIRCGRRSIRELQEGGYSTMLRRSGYGICSQERDCMPEVLRLQAEVHLVHMVQVRLPLPRDVCRDSLFLSEVEDRFQFYCFLYSKCEIQVFTCFSLTLIKSPCCRTRTVPDASLAPLPAGPRQRTGTSGPPPPPPPPPLPQPAPQCLQLHLYN